MDERIIAVKDSQNVYFKQNVNYKDLFAINFQVSICLFTRAKF